MQGPHNNVQASLASAPHWAGPYTVDAVDIFAEFYAKNITNEDCYWWESAAGTGQAAYHVLSHRMEPADRESRVSGGHAFSADGKTWHYAQTPAYSNDLAVADGSVLQLGRRERPQVSGITL